MKGQKMLIKGENKKFQKVMKENKAEEKNQIEKKTKWTTSTFNSTFDAMQKIQHHCCSESAHSLKC